MRDQILAPDMNPTNHKPTPIVNSAYCWHGLKTQKRHVGAQVQHSQCSAQGTLDQQIHKDQNDDACKQLAHNSAFATRDVPCKQDCREPETLPLYQENLNKHRSQTTLQKEHETQRLVATGRSQTRSDLRENKASNYKPG